jgi:hypothetical protein
MCTKHINHIHPPSSSPSILPLPTSTPPTHRTYFTILSFIFNSTVSVQRGFSIYRSHWIYYGSVSWTPSTPLLYLFPHSCFNYLKMWKTFLFLWVIHKWMECQIRVTDLDFLTPNIGYWFQNCLSYRFLFNWNLTRSPMETMTTSVWGGRMKC